jgi:murein DD-endopeptidase MepM/ murein hydrolase activator NlpD
VAQGAPESYVVREGDTLWRVALEVGVDLQEMPCLVAPTFRPDQPLVIGDRLMRLPPGWRCHEVQPGETLSAIAVLHGVSVRQLESVAWNKLNMLPSGVTEPPAGTFLRIPVAPADELGGGGFMAFMLNQPVTISPYVAYATGGPMLAKPSVPAPDNWPFGSGHFMWPVYGWLSQGYREDHRAIDIAATQGTFVTSADRGVVVRAGWNDQGYGNFVVIDHNIDYVTLYSHLTDVLVKEGEVVSQGQVIGTVGSSGNSTGPHLHFEIRDFGRRINPIELLLR